MPPLTISGEERTRLAEARIGQLVLGKWRLDRLIGIGGMAAVFEATQRNGNRVAIKMLHPDLTGFDEIRERFLAEGYVANRVSHPGVVTVRDEGTTEDGAVFLVMDLLRGKTLAQRLEQGEEPLRVGEVLEIARQLLDVLVHAHDRGIVHRDIKPENVFLTRQGRARLLDFGIARVEAAARTHAQIGTTLGTPAFMSPEQALGRWDDLDGRSDLWSLGATMYLLLSGTPVREPGSVTEQLLGAMIRPVPSLGQVTALPRSVIAVVDRALAFDRDERFPDARSMQLAVRATLDELSTPDSRTPAQAHAPTYGTVRPVAASTAPRPDASSAPSRSALPVYVTLGFAAGIGIVVLARLNLQTPVPQPAALLEPASAVLAPPLPSARQAATPASSSAAIRAPPPRSRFKPARSY